MIRSVNSDIERSTAKLVLVALAEYIPDEHKVEAFVKVKELVAAALITRDFLMERQRLNHITGEMK